MRIAVLTVPHHPYGNVVLNALLRGRGAQVVGVWQSTRLLPGRSYAAALVRYWRVAGPRYVAAQAVKSWGFRIGGVAYRLAGGRDPGNFRHDWRRLAREAGTPVRPVDDVNGARFLAELDAARPDVLLSILFNQILSAGTIARVPLAFNLHPAPLPHGRGVSPTFWALARGEGTAGVTWHRLAARVDAGEIVARETFDTAGLRTEHALYLEAVRRAARLLNGLLDALERGAPPSCPPAPDLAESYDSLPTRAAYRELRRRGGALFAPGELLHPGAGAAA